MNASYAESDSNIATGRVYVRAPATIARKKTGRNSIAPTTLKWF